MAEVMAAQIMEEHGEVDAIVGLDARGFLIGPLVAQLLGCPFVPVRKQGKLPGEVVTVAYAKEYGTDVFELQKGSVERGARVVIVDDAQ
jgi:adenine phosphoribosyltransferase